MNDYQLVVNSTWDLRIDIKLDFLPKSEFAAHQTAPTNEIKNVMQNIPWLPCACGMWFMYHYTVRNLNDNFTEFPSLLA